MTSSFCRRSAHSLLSSCSHHPRCTPVLPVTQRWCHLQPHPSPFRTRYRHLGALLERNSSSAGHPLLLTKRVQVLLSARPLFEVTRVKEEENHHISRERSRRLSFCSSVTMRKTEQEHPGEVLSHLETKESSISVMSPLAPAVLKQFDERPLFLTTLTLLQLNPALRWCTLAPLHLISGAPKPAAAARELAVGWAFASSSRSLSGLQIPVARLREERLTQVLWEC
mmetsp:Transcript_8628/g.12181  ORF Transcript_8628/g.12181 Transcript_8628/m.12181 type:complete len:225 (-) Transcript_8628:2137-2811(-)